MIKRIRSNKKFESMEDPREVLLSLIDLGSEDIEDVLIACVNTMSDREVKNVLGQFTLASVEDEFEDDVEEIDDAIITSDDDFVSDEDEEDSAEEDDSDEDEDDEDSSEEDDEETAELEARIRRLERKLVR